MKITWPRYFKCLLRLTKISPLLFAGHGNTLHILLFFMGTLHILHLIFANSPFLCIIRTFLNKILWETKIFSNRFKWLSCSGITWINILLQTAWKGIFFPLAYYDKYYKKSAIKTRLSVIFILVPFIFCFNIFLHWLEV